jgi:hypothetical protein
MFVFVFDGALFKFKAKAPALAPLSQFPPRRNADSIPPVFYGDRPIVFFLKLPFACQKAKRP